MIDQPKNRDFAELIEELGVLQHSLMLNKKFGRVGRDEQFIQDVRKLRDSKHQEIMDHVSGQPQQTEAAG